MIKHVIHDKDGTLERRNYGGFGPFSGGTEACYMQTKRRFRPVIREHNLPQAPLDKLKRLAAKFGTSMYPGAQEYLIKLKQDGYDLAIATAASKVTTETFLEKYGIKDLFSVVVTSKDVNNLKPDPECLKVALNKLEAEVEECVLVGGPLDGLTAKQIGMEFVPATRDFIKLYETIKAL